MSAKSIDLSSDLTRSELIYAGYVVTSEEMYTTKSNQIEQCLKVTINGVESNVYKLSDAKK